MARRKQSDDHLVDDFTLANDSFANGAPNVVGDLARFGQRVRGDGGRLRSSFAHSASFMRCRLRTASRNRGLCRGSVASAR